MRHADDEEGNNKGCAEKGGCEVGARMKVRGHVARVAGLMGGFMMRESLPMVGSPSYLGQVSFIDMISDPNI